MSYENSFKKMRIYIYIQNLHCKIQRVEWVDLAQWLVFLWLCGLSGYYIYTVLGKFFAEETSFKVYEEPIIEAPAITFCFSSPSDGKYSADKKIYSYGIDFNITVKVLDDRSEEKTLMKGKNVLEYLHLQFIILLDGLYTKYDGMCYMVTAEIKGAEFDPTITWEFSMHMNQSENSPNVHIYFTSKENAYGILQKEWTDGNYWRMEFDKPGLGMYATLAPSKTIYKGTTSQPCSKDSFWNCFERNFLPEHFDKCPKFCAAFSLPSNKVSLCKTFEEWHCIKHKIYHLMANLSKNGKCPMRPCKILEYKGNEVLTYPLKFKNAFLQIAFWFKSPKIVLVYEEYLIYDTWSTIGYIGGILGMTIGFSFTNTFATLIGLIKKLLSTNNKIHVENSQNISTAELQLQIENLCQNYIQDQRKMKEFELNYYEDQRILKCHFKELELKYKKLKGHEVKKPKA